MKGVYRPGQAVLRQLTGRRVVVVVGPTGAGKTTLIERAVARDPRLHLILSDMSRAPRAGEVDGVDAHFRTVAEMEQRMARGEYVNAVQGFKGGDVYATDPESFPREGVGIMPLFAEVVPEFRSLPFAALSVLFVLPPSWEVWQERMLVRHFTPEQRQKRLEEAERSLAFARDDPETLLIVNDDLARAERQFVRFSQESTPNDAAFLAGQQAARSLTVMLLQKVRSERSQ